MADVLTWRKVLKNFNLTFMSGDTSMLDEDADTAWTTCFTVSGFMANIVNFASAAELYIVPEAQDVHWSDGSGRATITLSPSRMDVNVNVANESLTVEAEVTNEDAIPVEVTNAADFPSGGGSSVESAEGQIVIAGLGAGGVPIMVYWVAPSSSGMDIMARLLAAGTTTPITSVLTSTIVFMNGNDSGMVDPATFTGLTYIEPGMYRVTADQFEANFSGSN